MIETPYRGVLVDVCQICLGIWLDRDELRAIVSLPGRAWPAATVANAMNQPKVVGIPEEELARTLVCPVCSAHLVPVHYQANSGVIINSCTAGHGVWLDGGELTQIQIYLDYWCDKLKS